MRVVLPRLRPYVQNGGVDGVQVFLKDERSKFRLVIVYIVFINIV